MIITCNWLDPSKFLVDAAENSFIDTTALYKQFPSHVSDHSSSITDAYYLKRYRTKEKSGSLLLVDF
jgi:hypothetical protein